MTGEPVLHSHEGELPREGYGPAIDSCDEREDHTLWVGNGEYRSQVNFCPYCGFEAAVKVEVKFVTERAPTEQAATDLRDLDAVFSGSISDSILTVVSISHGEIGPGLKIEVPGALPGTKIVEVLSQFMGFGTFRVEPFHQNVSSCTMVGFYSEAVK